MKPRFFTTLAAFGLLLTGCANAANVTLSGLTETTALSESDPFETVHAGASRKVTLANIRVALALQPLDGDLTAIAALTTASYGRSLLEAANAGAARTTLGLGGASLLAVGTTGGTVAAGDHVHAIADITGVAAMLTTPGTVFGSTTSPFTGSYLHLADGGPPSVPTAGLRLYSSAGNDLSWLDSNNHQARFKTSLSTSGHVYTLPDAAGTVTLGTGAFTLDGTAGSTLNIGTGGTLGTAAYTATTAYDAAGVAAAAITAERTATRTLTGATISGSSNTLTNLPAANVTGNLPGQAYLEFTDSAIPTTPTGALRVYSDASSRFSLLGAAGFTAKFSLSGLTSNRVYSLPDAAGTLVLGSGSGVYTIAGTTGSTLNIGTGGTLGTAAYTATTAYDAAGVSAAGITTERSAVRTLTNVRITPRVLSHADATTPTVIDSDSYDGVKFLELSQTTVFANPTTASAPAPGQRLWLRIKSTTARAISFGTQYRWSTDIAAVTTTTGGGKTDYLVFQWNADDSKWDVLGKNFGF